MSPDDPRHGKTAGRRVHQRDGEQPCAPCAEANATYQRRYRKTRVLYGDRLIPAIGTTRRIHALQRLGWSIPVIAEHLDMAARQLWWTTTQTLVTRQVAERVAEVYEALSMSLPATDTKGQRISVSKVRTHAERMGWLPPLAWDDIDRDPEPPAALYSGPGIDPVVVMRLLEGDRNVTSNAAEKDEAMRQWRADGGSERELCIVLGWKTGRYGRLRVVEEAS